MDTAAIKERLIIIQRSGEELANDVALLDSTLDKLISSMDSVYGRVMGMKKALPAVPGAFLPAGSPPTAVMTALTIDEIKAHIEKIVAGSLDAVGNKISNRVMVMLKELKTLSGDDREAKILEIKDAAIRDNVDLSMLYKHGPAQSHIVEIGGQEKESKGIFSSLARLQKMRDIDKGPGNTGNEKKKE